MKPVKLLLLSLVGIFGVWLLYWNIVDYVTTGLNTGIWNYALIENAFPSIFLGFIIVTFCSILGIKVLNT